MSRKSSTRAASGSGTIRKKTVAKNGKSYIYWEARYTEGYDPGTGKQIQRSITGKTQKEVAQKLKAATVAVDAGTCTAPSRMTVGEWLDIWVAEYLGNTKPHTRKSYTGIINNHIKPAIGAVKLAALTPIQVQKMINGIQNTKKTSIGKQVNPKTVKNVHGVLHSALSQAVLCEYIRTNPADRVVLPKRVKAEIHVLGAQQLVGFMKAIEGHPFQYLYLVDLFTGMRQSELLGLQWPDIDFEAKTITVKRQLQYLGSQHGGYQYATPKNNKSRLIMLPDVAVQALKNQKAKQSELRLAVGEAWYNPDSLVFTNELGEHIKHDVVYRNLKRIFARMGVPDMRFHDLRHSYAVLSLQAGCDIKTVQENLGCQRQLENVGFRRKGMSFFAGQYTSVYSLNHHITCRFEARQALIYQLVLGMTGENDTYNYSKAVHVYPPFFHITCSAKNYKIAPALTWVTTPQRLRWTPMVMSQSRCAGKELTKSTTFLKRWMRFEAKQLIREK